MLMELYKSLTNTFVTHPLPRAGPALNDVVAGQVPMVLDNLPSALPFIKDNRLVPIVVAAPQRLAVLPNVPTFKEVGLEPVNRMAYYGILGPKNMPKDVVDKINAAVRKVLQDPAVRKRIEDTGSLVIGNSPEEFAKQIKEEYETYKKVVAQQNSRWSKHRPERLDQSPRFLADLGFFVVGLMGCPKCLPLPSCPLGCRSRTCCRSCILARAAAGQPGCAGPFMDALLLEDGLSRNTLAAYRRDLTAWGGGWRTSGRRWRWMRRASWSCRAISRCAWSRPRPARRTGG